MARDADTRLLLAASAGFQAFASDGPLGVIETPLFPPDSREPDFLVIRLRGWSRTRRPIVSIAFVESVDTEARTVHLVGRRHELERLPEHVPIAI